tara:strand:- start:272 stop:733 length:462 start_codon:yes stop_codon:yes gene_type:complete
MRVGKLLGALGNLKQIAEGIANNVFKKEDVEDIAAKRWEICLKCPSLDRVGVKCAMPGTQPCCAACGCSMGLKLRALSSNCPNGHWDSVLTVEQEDDLKKSIYPHLDTDVKEPTEEERKSKKSECNTCKEKARQRTVQKLKTRNYERGKLKDE